MWSDRAQRADICSRLQQPDRPGHHWIWRFGVGQRVDDHLLQHSERRLRGRGLRHSLTDRRRAPTPEGVGGEDLIGQLGCWQPEHRAGGAGSKPQPDYGRARWEDLYQRLG